MLKRGRPRQWQAAVHSLFDQEDYRPLHLIIPLQIRWMQGRATFFNPSSLIIKSLRNSPFEPVPDGDCGMYNGGNKKDNSAITVPANMPASMVTSNLDYPGSCGTL